MNKLKIDLSNQMNQLISDLSKVFEFFVTTNIYEFLENLMPDNHLNFLFNMGISLTDLVRYKFLNKTIIPSFPVYYLPFFSTILATVSEIVLDLVFLLKSTYNY